MNKRPCCSLLAIWLVILTALLVVFLLFVFAIASLVNIIVIVIATIVVGRLTEKQFEKSCQSCTAKRAVVGWGGKALHDRGEKEKRKKEKKKTQLRTHEQSITRSAGEIAKSEATH